MSHKEQITAAVLLTDFLSHKEQITAVVLLTDYITVVIPSTDYITAVISSTDYMCPTKSSVCMDEGMGSGPNFHKTCEENLTIRIIKL